jgi:signal transduction histidine kinase
MAHPVRLVCITLLLAGSISYVTAQQKPMEPSVTHGILDLRETDFSSTTIQLDGEWSFWWKQLLTPEQIKSIPATYVQVPFLWNKLEVNGEKLPHIGYATYACTILMPKQKPTMGIQVHHAYTSYKLYANGHLLTSNGTPGTTAATTTPFWTTRTVTLPAADTIELVMQVSNFFHGRGGINKSIVVGSRDKVLRQYYIDVAYDLVLAGCLFMGGLFFFGLFTFGRHDKTILFFSLFCMVYSYRMIGTELYILHALFPSLNWFVTLKLEYLTLVISIGLFGKYTLLLYPRDGHPFMLKMLISLCILYGALILITTPAVYTPLLFYFLILCFVYIAYGIYIYMNAFHHKRSGSLYALLSSGVMFLIFLVISFKYFGIIEPSKGWIFGGYIAFFFLQSMVLSHRFSDKLKRSARDAEQALHAKSVFLSNMSHEIRTPLNSVIGMSHLLQRNKPRPDQQKNLEVLMFSADNLLSIVNNILDYNKIEAGKIQFEKIPMDLPAIARNIIAGLQTIADEKRISLHAHIDAKLTRKVMGDPTRTSQVMNNLLHNAIKFTKSGSVLLELRVEEIHDHDIRVSFVVTDTGIGIEPEKQQLIFDRFTQADSSTSRRYGGTGLGLAICNKILELQGVQLKLKSEPGKGSCFYFTQDFLLLEDRVNALHTPTAVMPEHSKPFKGMCILLVEDNPMNVLVAQTFLERCGANIDVATNGREALDKFNNQKHCLVLMDLDMPEMDGYEATRRLRLKGETLPVIALTASVPNEVEKEVYAAGLTNIIVKPFNPDDLFRVLLQYMN